MNLNQLHINGYRSIRSLECKLSALNVVVGANGCGKTNLYRSLYLLGAAADGRLSHSIAEEGGMASALWAGERTKGPVRLTLKVRLDDVLYEIALGLPPPAPTIGPARSVFVLDPEVKEEKIAVYTHGRAVNLLDRKNTTVNAREVDGVMQSFPGELSPAESVLADLREPHRFPVLSALRGALLHWRFYHQFRTDEGSPIRQPQIGVRTPALSHDGRDLAAALQTIIEIGDRQQLADSIHRAFAGAYLDLDCDKGRFETRLRSPQFQRPFQARELSDGTLRYLCLLAALLSPTPPLFMAFNEPEASLHPDLFEPLADLFIDASKVSQILVTTHSERLATLLARRENAVVVRLVKVEAETQMVREKQE
jgi:predicted ATPase